MSPVLAAADELINWYWNQGKQRSGTDRVSPAGWLRPVYELREGEDARLQNQQAKKASLGIWGASSTGKSTFLAAYIDAKADVGAKGGSLITWLEKVRFSGDKDLQDPGVTILNPYRGTNDASGCVSRFTARDSVPFPDSPVELKFVSHQQIMHALAAGYAYECAESAHKVWTEDSLRRLLEDFPARGPADRTAYESLLEVYGTFVMLRSTGLNRYGGIGDLDALARLILDHPGLNGDMAAVEKFVAALFWDGQPLVTRTFEQMARWSDRFAADAEGNAPMVYTSFKIASCLLNIGSYGNLLNRDKQYDGLRALVGRLAFQHRPDGSCTLGETGGEPLGGSFEDFASFAGAIQEMVIPLRRAEMSGVLRSLFENADLVDFPGTPNDQRGGERAKVDLKALRPGDDVPLYEKLVKRGKTFSVVSRAIRRVEIHGLTILARFKKAVGNPETISNYVAQWFEGLTGQPMPTARSREAPLNLLLTFAGEMFADTLTNRRVAEPFAVFGTLGTDLTNPDIVSIYPVHALTPDVAPIVATTTAEERRFVLDLWSRDRDCQRWFRDREQELARLVNEPDGGTNDVLKKLARDAAQPRDRFLAVHGQQNQAKLHALFAQVHNSAHDEALRRTRALENWKTGIGQALRTAEAEMQANQGHDDPVRRVAVALRKLLAVNPRSFDDIPEQFSRTPINVGQFTQRQIVHWEEDMLANRSLPWTGLADQAHLQLVLGAVDAFLLSRLDVLTDWVHQHLNNVTGADDRRFFRTYLGLRIARELTDHDIPHAPITDNTVAKVRELHDNHQRSLSQNGDLKDSIHYLSGIKPVLDLIEKIKAAQGTPRKKLEGEDELSNLAVLHPILRADA